MNVTDLIIIYLACGSPFGVFQLTRDLPVGAASRWAGIAASFLLWPAFAVSILAGRISQSKTPSLGIESIRSQIEEIAFSGSPVSLLFEFREVFYRYTGLIQAAKEGAQPAKTLPKNKAPRDDAIASRCIARRNRAKLEFHLTRTRNEFVDLVCELASNNRDIIKLALELAAELGDDAAANDLEASRDVPENSRRTHFDKEARESQSHSTSTI